MNDKTKIWKSSTTTRSWSSTKDLGDLNDLDDLSPEDRANIQALLEGFFGTGSGSQKWSYAGTENGETFKVDIENGAVTINGRRYNNMDEVPRADRERIEALQSGEGMEGLWGMLKNAGVDAEGFGVDAAQRNGRPAFTIETESGESGVGTAGAGTAATAMAATSGRAQSDLHTSSSQQDRKPDSHQQDPSQSPGAVPAGGGLRRMLLIGIAIGLGLWVARALNLF